MGRAKSYRLLVALGVPRGTHGGSKSMAGAVFSSLLVKMTILMPLSSEMNDF